MMHNNVVSITHWANTHLTRLRKTIQYKMSNLEICRENNWNNYYEKQKAPMPLGIYLFELTELTSEQHSKNVIWKILL